MRRAHGVPPTRRAVLRAGLAAGSGAAMSSALGCAAGPRAAADADAVPVPAGYTAYGGWSEQRPGEHFRTMGRYDPFCTRAHPDGSVDVWCRYDRGEADMLRRVGAADALPDCAWRSGSWSSTHNSPAAGRWEVDLTVPARPGIGYVLMLWPAEDAWWPTGEVNIAEGVSGADRTMTNLHWRGADGRPDHSPAFHPLPSARRHRLAVEVGPGLVAWFVDGRMVRELRSPHAPHDVAVHLVFQCAAKRPHLGTEYPDDFWFQERFEIHPRLMPA